MSPMLAHIEMVKAIMGNLTSQLITNLTFVNRKKTVSAKIKAQKKNGRRTRAWSWRYIQRGDASSTKTLAHRHWQRPLCCHVVLGSVQGKERWPCCLGLEASMGRP